MVLSNGDGFRCSASLGSGVIVEVETCGMGMGLSVSTRDAREMLEELRRAIQIEEISNANVNGH